MATRDEIKSVIGYLALAFPSFSPILDGTPNSVDVYADLLGDLDASLLRLAVREACAELGRKFAPSPGEIREAVANLQSSAAGTPSAAEAWGAVMESFRRLRSDPPQLLGHPLVNEAVRCMGGLEQMGQTEEDQLGVLRAHFLKTYEQLLTRARQDVARLPASQAYIEGQRRLLDGTAWLAGRLSSPRILKDE